MKLSQGLKSLSSQLCYGSIESYIAHVNQIPTLSQEEELALAIKFNSCNDLNAAKKLILANLRYVIKIAKGYLGYGLPLADLIQEGNIGLMKAVKRFNHALGVRLVTFAAHWIKAELHNFILRNWRIVKIATTKAQRKLFFNLRRMKKSLNWLGQQEIAEIAQDLGVNQQEVREMEMRLYHTDATFDGPETTENPTALYPADYLTDPTQCPALYVEQTRDEEQQSDSLQLALQQLDQRSQEIVRTRWLISKKQTLQALATKYQVSAERVRQLENNAIKKLRQLLMASPAKS